LQDSIDWNIRKALTIENIQSSFSGAEFDLYGGAGSDCGVYLPQFPIGDTLLVRFDSIGWSYNFLSICGVNYLRYSNGKLFGPIYSNAYDSVDYNVFKSTFDICIAHITKTDDEPDQKLSVFPNPAQDQINISIEGLQINAIQLFNVHGQILLTEPNHELKRTSLDIGHLSSGIYFLKVLIGEDEVTRKIVVL